MNKETTKPWSQSYPPGLNWELDAVDAPVSSILENATASFPDRPCLEFLGAKFTYTEVLQKVNRFAAGLQKSGVKKGDKIGLCLPNSPYYVIAYFAALKIGAIVVNFNILYTDREIEQQIKDSGARLMVTLDLKMLFDKVYPLLKSQTIDRVIYCPLGDMLPPVKKYMLKFFSFYKFAHPHAGEYLIPFKKLCALAELPEPVAINPSQDIALFQYTGGTTGTPKAAMLTHSNIVSNAEQVYLWLQQGDKFTGREKFLAVLPFFHVFSMTAAMNLALRSGAEIVLLPRFDIKQCLQAIAKQKVTIFPAVPAIFNAINQYPQRQNYDLSSLLYGISGGASLPKEVNTAFETNTGCCLVEGYGLSESSPVITCNPSHNGGKKGSIGLPIPGTDIEFRQIDDITVKEEQGSIGQLLVRGPQVMQGYWNRDEENASTLLPGGWLKTGDVGYMDEAGFVYLTDRMKDIIISNGYNIYPRHIEDAFYEHPDVEEVIAIGVPDDEKGEVPKVFVKLNANSSLGSKELLEFVEKKLNPIECPDTIEIRNELPKTLIGKPDKKALMKEEASKREQNEETS